MEKGDKIICLKDGNYKLDIFGVYIIYDIRYDFKNDGALRYILLENKDYRYEPDRFITIKEYRKLKLNRLNDIQ